MLSDSDAKANGGEFIPIRHQLTFLRFLAASAFSRCVLRLVQEKKWNIIFDCAAFERDVRLEKNIRWGNRERHCCLSYWVTV